MTLHFDFLHTVNLHIHPSCLHQSAFYWWGKRWGVDPASMQKSSLHPKQRGDVNNENPMYSHPKLKFSALSVADAVGTVWTRLGWLEDHHICLHLDWVRASQRHISSCSAAPWCPPIPWPRWCCLHTYTTSQRGDRVWHSSWLHEEHFACRKCCRFENI